MNWNVMMKRIAAIFLVVLLVLQVTPMDAEDSNRTFYSEWWSPQQVLAPIEHSFSGVGDSVLLPYLLAGNGIYGGLTDVSLDSDAVTLGDDLYLTATGYFDSVTLSVTVNGIVYTVVLHNPGGETPIPAGTEVSGESGSFTAAGEVPAGTALVVGAFEPTEALRAAIPADEADAVTVWLEIGLQSPDGEAVHTGAEVSVNTQIELPAPPALNGLTGRAVIRGARLYHVTGESTVEELPVEVETVEGAITALRFTAPSFSGFALSYTVDFEYSVNGQTFEFSLPGGGYVTLRQLAAALGIGINDEAAVERFLADVEQVTFSDPSLVWAGQAAEETTVGQIKAAHGLVSEYSAELTEAQVAEIDGAAIAAGEWLLISLKPFTSEETLTVTMRNGEAWTVKVTDGQIVALYLSASGQLYEVTVTYDDDAQIPDGAKLKITEFNQGSEAYTNARNAVLADLLARGETVDLSTFELAALDISILDADGHEIEPAAPVRVDMTIKSLPGVDDLSEIIDTLQVQHHVEVDNGVVVETVFDGATRAAFTLDTNAAVAAAGIVVDPDSVSEEDFAPAVLAPAVYAPTVDGPADDVHVSFNTPVFSTFTVTWSGSSADSRSSLNGHSFFLVNSGANAAMVAENTSNNTRLRAVRYNPADTSITKWYFQRQSNNDYYYYISDGNGRYLNIGNGNSSYVRVSNSPQLIYVDKNNNNQFRLQRSNNQNSTAVNLYSGSIDSGFGPYNDRGNNEWFTAYYPDAAMATIHYVDTDEQELTVSKGTIASDTLLGSNAYLIYDIEGGGYEYKETIIRRAGTDTAIRAYLRLNNGRWQYTTNGSNWSNVESGDDIYVKYKKKATPPSGGTPTLVELDEDEKPERPTILKDSKVNGDGTNTLSLSVTSHTKPREVLKLADVIVIFDRSGSMGQRIDGTSTTSDETVQRMALLKKAVNGLAETLIGDDSEYIYTDPEDGRQYKQIRMSLVSFSNTATNATGFTDDEGEFAGWVNNLDANGGTNWEQALQKANEAAVDDGRATFVIFATDGEPTFRMTRMTDTDVSLYNSSTQRNDIRSDYYYPYNVYGNGSYDDFEYSYQAALVQAKSIVAKNKNLYMIGIGPSVANLSRFNADAGADGYYSAESAEALEEAFEDIKRRIAATAGYSDIKISDGITNLTQTVQKSSLVSFAEDDFTYYKGAVDHLATQADVDAGRAAKVGDPVVLTWESWDPASEHCAEAVYRDGAVVWNMGDDFMPQDGYSYQVRFKVWPSQAAYDLLADLNNGVKSYDTLPEDVKAQIKEPTTTGGMYTLKTNSDTSYNYKEATLVDGTVTTEDQDLLNPPGSFADVDPLELTTKPLQVKKQWHNNYVDSRDLDKLDHITMELYGVDPDGATSHDFKTITLTKESGWYAANNYISYGLVTYNTATNKGEKIYETGHDFTLRETDDEAHYYELTAGVYRPMFINGTPTILEKIDAAPSGMSADVFHYYDGTHHYYRMDGKIYRDTQSDILVIATNSHRSYLELIKTVVDEDGNPVLDDQMFEYTIKLTVPAGTPNYDTLEKYLWFSVYDTVARRTLTRDEYVWDDPHLIKPEEEDPAFSGPEYANYLVALSGQAFTIKLRPGWSLRFLNLLNGTTYSFEETEIPSGYSFVRADVTGTRWIANMVDGVDQGHAETMTGLPSNTSGDNTNTGISGTIDYANARYRTTYTNTTLTKEVKVLKVSTDGTTVLPGAKFTLYTESGYDASPKRPASDLTTGADGTADLGSLSYGTYYLVETGAPDGYTFPETPIVITVGASGVTATQGTRTVPVSGNDQDGYVLSVDNEPVTTELPIPVQKVMRGRDLARDEFSFVLQPIDIDGHRDETARQTIYNPAGEEGETVTFHFNLDFSTDDIVNARYLDMEGHAVYYYVVYEEQGNEPGVIYSTLQYIVRVTLIPGSGTLEAIPAIYPYSGEGPLPAEATEGLQRST